MKCIRWKTMRNAIETKNLTKVYKNFTAVNSLNLKVPEKSIFGRR
mgnify:FL=1